MELARRMVRPPVMVAVDIEAGFSADPGRVADLAATLVPLGVVGINIEDGRGKVLAPAEVQTRPVQAVRSATPPLFINARTDTHWVRPRSGR